MSSDRSITRLVGQLQGGDPATAQEIWEVYFGRLVGLARARLRGAARGRADEEDVALSAFDSFFRRAERGQFPQLRNRDDLWQVLFVLTVRKAANHAKHEGRQARGGGRVRSLGDPEAADAEGLAGGGPTPELAAQFGEEVQRLLDRLGDATLRAVALWKLEGYTNREVASKLGCVEQTVERKLRAIRLIWSGEGSP